MARPPFVIPNNTHYGKVESIGGVSLNEDQYSGYVRVAEETALFYHYIQSSNVTAPLLLWTNGGPGASSVQYGDFFQNIGPFVVVDDASTNTASQTTQHSTQSPHSTAHHTTPQTRRNKRYRELGVVLGRR